MFRFAKHIRQMQKVNSLTANYSFERFLQGGCNLVLNPYSFNRGYQQGCQLVQAVVLYMM